MRGDKQRKVKHGPLCNCKLTAMRKNEGVIVGHDVVSLRARRHIIGYWEHPKCCGKTLCGQTVGVAPGSENWRNVRGAKWDVELDCGNCLRILSAVKYVLPE